MRPGRAGTAGDEADARRVRVLFVVWQYSPVPAGGAEHQARLQAEALARHGHEVVVLAPRASGAPPSGLLNGVFVRRLPAIDRRPFRTATYLLTMAVYLLVRLRSFDLMHLHLAGVYTDALVALAWLLRRPVYIKLAAGGESGEVARLRRFARFTRYYGLRHAARIQALSEEIEREVLAIDVPPERIVRLPNGIDTGRFAPCDEATRQAARSALALPADDVVVLYCGRFSRYKGVLDVLAAWQRPDPPDATLVMVGYRRDRPPEEQVEVASPPPRVLIRAWTDDVLPYLHAADVFVLPSHSEGMSNVVLEAMACGLPVVATRVGAAPVMIEDGTSGCLVAARDPDALAAALRTLAGDEALRQRLGRGAAERVRAHYGIDQVAARIAAAYREVLG